jgi:ParB family chromosome partitioning protein
MDRTIASVPVAKIRGGERLRSLRENAVVPLVESIKRIGLQVPISVQIDPESREERYLLVAGLHRLEACRRLGMVHIDARIVDLDEAGRRLCEIAENLHRSELTALERSEQIALWIKLATERAEVSRQLDPKLPRKGVGQGIGGGRPTSGVNLAVRELDVDRDDAQRSVRIAGLAPEAKTEARALGLDHNQRALLGASKAPSKEAQVRALREEAARKAAGPDPANASEARMEAAKTAVKRLSPEEFKDFARWFDRCRVAGLSLVVEKDALHVDFERDLPADLIEDLRRQKSEIIAAITVACKQSRNCAHRVIRFVAPFGGFAALCSCPPRHSRSVNPSNGTTDFWVAALRGALLGWTFAVSFHSRRHAASPHER